MALANIIMTSDKVVYLLQSIHFAFLDTYQYAENFQHVGML